MKREKWLAATRAVRIALLAAAFLQTSTKAQETQKKPQEQMPDMPGMDHSTMQHNGMEMNATESFLMRESSGTVFQPSAWPMPMLMTNVGSWYLMWMAQGFLVDTQQSGPRGGDKLYSANWGMLSAVHRLGRGAVMLRSMVSLEPLTVTDRRYPLLFQTGETAFGKSLADAQHPHDLFMEVGVQYAHPLGENGTWNVYYAPVGEPALGPVAFPHRASAMEIPQATLGHHWQDSTHIANNVVTAGVSYKIVRLEASGFYGREPNENRWNFDFGAMDSWSTRFSVFPSANWSGQVSFGRLRNPEELHPGDVVRTTASIHYVRPAAGKNWWATSLIWGRNYKTDGRYSTNSLAAETVVPFRRNSFVTGRYEWSQRDELLDHTVAISQNDGHAEGNPAFQVHAFTAGYTRDVNFFRNVQTGVGANVSTYVIDHALQPYYGTHPWGISMFVRFRLKAPA